LGCGFLGFRVAELACEVIRVLDVWEALSLKKRGFRGIVEGGGGPVEAAAQAGRGARAALGAGGRWFRLVVVAGAYAGAR
jgi:hypothetical protein